MKELSRKFSRIIYWITPKLNQAVIWSWPDNEDNGIALEQALQKTGLRKIYLLVSDVHLPPTWRIGPKTLRIQKNSLGGWLRFCFAKYVFFTHPCFTRNFPPNVVSVNIWHGMPIKKIGLLIDNDPVIRSSHTLATSPFWAGIMRRTLSPSGSILPIGLPRNDRLFSDRDSVLRKIGSPADAKLVTWLPTYRKSVRGLPRTDGIESDNLFGIPDLNSVELNAFLESRNCFLLVKPHPMAASGGVRQWSNLILIDDRWLCERSVSLYETLGASDLLISDVSSVVIDYLLLDRPVIHAFSDLDKYAASRGFTVEPIEDYFVGPVVSDQAGLISTLESLLDGIDPDADRRIRVREISHSHMDGKSTERLLEAMGIIS